MKRVTWLMEQDGNENKIIIQLSLAPLSPSLSLSLPLNTNTQMLAYLLPQRHTKWLIVVVTRLAEKSTPTPEIRGLNPVVGNFD